MTRVEGVLMYKLTINKSRSSISIQKNTQMFDRIIV
jgi:hypothetical protein